MNEYKFNEQTQRIEKISKGLLRSKTAWGGIIAVFPTVWNTALENLPAISESIDVVVAAGVLNPKTAALIAAVGGILAIIGRVKAEGKIEGIK